MSARINGMVNRELNWIQPSVVINKKSGLKSCKRPKTFQSWKTVNGDTLDARSLIPVREARSDRQFHSVRSMVVWGCDLEYVVMYPANV